MKFCMWAYFGPILFAFNIYIFSNNSKFQSTYHKKKERDFYRNQLQLFQDLTVKIKTEPLQSFIDLFQFTHEFYLVIF